MSSVSSEEVDDSNNSEFSADRNDHSGADCAVYKPVNDRTRE